jgi:hypothetical protein
MKSTAVARFWVVIMIGIFTSYLIHLDYLRWSRRGRDAFLVAQGLRFDKFMAAPALKLPFIVGVVIFVGLAIGIYELLVLLVSRFLAGSRANADPNSAAEYVQPR